MSSSPRSSVLSTLTTRAPAGIGLDDLAILGPILVLKVEFAPADHAPPACRGQLWLYPDNSMILELSTRRAPSEAFQIGSRTTGSS